MPGDTRDGYHDTFELRGRRYDAAMRRWPTVRAEELSFALGLVEPRPGEVLVDIPSGGGYLAEHVAAGVHVRAVDASPVFLECSRERGLQPIESDLTGAALAEGEADVVVSVAGMHHTDDHLELFTAWHRLLRPGGRLAAVDVISGSPEAVFLDGVVGEWTSTGHAGRFFTDDTAAQVEAAGFVDVRVVDGRYHWWADDDAELTAFCTELFALEEAAPADVLAALRAGPGIEHDEAGRSGLRWGLRAVVARTAGPAGAAG
ncbi:class I SAM-dependent methyltransferase [Aquihabitans sp. McL0605]|uniref:class I SAM-dependent methyltransferase n=1 Tax=Aquihabitans sp. McL0605 TaxID=3415671 RepID=UPI003CEC07EE